MLAGSVMLSLKSIEKRIKGPGYCSYGAKACFQNVKTNQVRKVMPSLYKQKVAKEVIDSFSSNRLVAIFHYNDVNCRDWKRLRSKLTKYEIKLRVIPARISSKVLLETKYKNIVPLFKGCTAIAYSRESSPISDLVSVVKSERKLLMLGGLIDNQMFTPQGMKKCAALPPMTAQHLLLSRTLTMSQSFLQTCLMHNQQKLSDLIKHIPEKS